MRTIPLDKLTWNWHFDTQIILEFLKQGYRVGEVPIPTYYGDEICHVNGIPYAMHCVASCAHFALMHRGRIHASLPAAQGSEEQPSTDCTTP
jgi:hypothetical protein